MPQPTKEQFDAAARKVMGTAPAGLSREQFFALVDKELGGGKYETDEGTRGAITRAVARSSGGIVPTQATRDELGNDVGPDGKSVYNTKMGGGKLTNFFANTVRNPILTSVANPTKAGDVAAYLLPDATALAPDYLRGMKRVITTAGKEAADGPVLSSPVRFMKGGVREALKSPTQLFNERPLYEQMSAFPERPAPMASHTPGPSVTVPPEPQFTNPGQVTGKAPTLEDALAKVIDEIRAEGGGKPPLVSSHPSPLETAGAGPLKQSGKFGKSGSLGQPGGFTSGRPPITQNRMDELVNTLGGRGDGAPGVNSPSPVDAGAAPAAETDLSSLKIPEKFSRTPEWHSGAEPGSPEAQRAQSTHKYEGEMDDLFQHKMDDPFASLLLAILGGGSAGALMSSHGDEP